MRIRVLHSLAFFLFFLLLAGVSLAQQRVLENPRGVVEMFTSQGCSSCPPADRVLGDYAKRGDVLALSWHVDYWNYLGWSDTFSEARFSERQRSYANAFRRRGVYTPQAVVNGRDHVVGSDRRRIEGLLSDYASSGLGLTVPVSLTRVDDKRVRFFAEGADLDDAELWIVYFDSSHTVDIGRGENRGRTITYHNIVRDYSLLGSGRDGVLDVTLPLSGLKHEGSDSCALLLQRNVGGIPGAIIGAAVLYDLQGS